MHSESPSHTVGLELAVPNIFGGTVLARVTIPHGGLGTDGPYSL